MSDWGHRGSSSAAVAASMIYSKAVTIICDVWHRTQGTELDFYRSGSAKDRFNRLVEALEAQLTSKEELRTLAEQLDVGAKGSVQETLDELVRDVADADRLTDIDDLSPNDIKSAIYQAAAAKAGDSVVDLDVAGLLRAALDKVFAERGISGRMNIGANRHWPRLFAYLRECEAETDWSPLGCGLWIKNASGAGPVAKTPRDPRRLKVTVDPTYLP